MIPDDVRARARRNRYLWYVLIVLATLTLAFQAVNIRHVYFALVPYNSVFAIGAAGAWTFVPVAVVLANVFRSNASSRSVSVVLFLVAFLCFLTEALANFAIGVFEASSTTPMLQRISELLAVPYKTTLIAGAVCYAMTPSLMTAGLVWAVSNAVGELTAAPPPSPEDTARVAVAIEHAAAAAEHAATAAEHVADVAAHGAPPRTP
jgi:hypothetical protein